MSISNGNGNGNLNGYYFGGNNNNGRLNGYMNSNGSQGSLNGYVKGNFADIKADMQAMEKSSMEKRLEPPATDDMLRWVRQTLRDQSERVTALKKENASLIKAGELATVGLNRLGGLVKFDKRLQYEYLIDLHKDFTFRLQNISYALETARDTIKETTLNFQFVGESLNKPLADRHKKIAVRKELGLRLRDTDSNLDRTENEVNHQKLLYKQLSEGIQKLMNEASLHLPPNVKDQMNKEDEVNRLALKHKKSLEKGFDVLNPNPYNPPAAKTKVKMLGSLGTEDSAEPTTAVEEIVTETTATEAFDPKFAVASTTIGVIAGIILFFVLMKKG